MGRGTFSVTPQRDAREFRQAGSPRSERVMCTTPPSRCLRIGSPERAKTASIDPFSASFVARDFGEVTQQAARDAEAVIILLDDERDLRGAGGPFAGRGHEAPR